MENIFFDILGYIFRKVGLFSRYIFYMLIGKKQSLKRLDRRQRDPVSFTQRGINISIGVIEVVILIIFLIKIL